MDDGEELRECGVSLVRLEDMKMENSGILDDAMEVRDLEHPLGFPFLNSQLTKFPKLQIGAVRTVCYC